MRPTWKARLPLTDVLVAARLMVPAGDRGRVPVRIVAYSGTTIIAGPYNAYSVNALHLFPPFPNLVKIKEQFDKLNNTDFFLQCNGFI